VQLGVPGYLPALVHPVVPWARRHVLRVARRYGLGPYDLWDETIAALLRASVSYAPTTGAFGPYARTAIHRACWRYVVRGQRARPAVLLLEDIGEPQELTAPSAEAEAIAREAVRRAWALREHAVIASSRGGTETASRLHDAAATAAALARAPGRRRGTARALYLQF
jgi:DNA-directed RNA polymerase specialized sigma24 family protein